MVLRYAVALTVPAALALFWVLVPQPWDRVPVSLLLLAIAVIVRYFGDGPAIAAIIASAVTLWFRVYPFWTPPPPPAEVLGRVALFVLAAVLMAAISRRASEETGELRATATSLVELSPAGILYATATGSILYANPALRRLLGVTKDEEIIGKHALDIVHADSHDVVTRRMSETPVGHVAPWMEEKWQRRDGTAIDVEVAGVSVSKDHRVGWLVYVRDLTERRKAEERLRESHERFRKLFESAIEAIVTFDDRGRCIEANASAIALLGYGRDEIVTKSIGDFIAERDPDARPQLFDFDQGGGEGVIRRKNGEVRDVEYRFYASVGRRTHCVFLLDVTDRQTLLRNAQQFSTRLLESQDQERRRIARQLHETTAQTLAALRMNLLRAEDATPELTAALWKESVALTEQGIREVRTLSHLLYPPLIEDLGVVAALRWYIDGFSQRSGIAVALDAPETLGRFSGAVENGVFRIVQEALTNIHRHSGSAVARVALSRRETDELFVVIEDEGRGMPVPEPGTSAVSGVGLAAMKERAKELGGHFHIVSGEAGTRIEVTLPIGDLHHG